MIYFIFLSRLALVTCYLAFHWKNITEFLLRELILSLCLFCIVSESIHSICKHRAFVHFLTARQSYPLVFAASGDGAMHFAGIALMAKDKSPVCYPVLVPFRLYYAKGKRVAGWQFVCPQSCLPASLFNHRLVHLSACLLVHLSACLLVCSSVLPNNFVLCPLGNFSVVRTFYDLVFFSCSFMSFLDEKQ